MATVEKISVALTPEMADMVRNAVNSGEYASGSEVIRDALREWKLKRVLHQRQIEQVRRQWQEGLDSGRAEPFDADDIKQEVRERSAAGKSD